MESPDEVTSDIPRNYSLLTADIYHSRSANREVSAQQKDNLLRVQSSRLVPGIYMIAFDLKFQSNVSRLCSIILPIETPSAPCMSVPQFTSLATHVPPAPSML